MSSETFVPAPQIQSSLTPWSAVALAQALVWFFVLPTMVKPYWEGFWLSYSPLQQELILNFMGVITFVVYSLVMLPVYYFQLDFFEQYKISTKPWGWLKSNPPEVTDAFWTQTRRSMKLLLFNQLFLMPVMTAGKVWLMPSGPAFAVSEWPTLTEMIHDHIMLTLIHELGFYCTHRLMHTPSLYRWHKVHHEYKQNNVLAAQHNDPIDYIVSLACPALLALSIVKAHSIVHFQWVLWLIVANLDDHVGYNFPWSPVRWFPLAGLTEMHEFHHSENKGCFASKLKLYDMMFNSEATYLKWADKRKQAFLKQE